MSRSGVADAPDADGPGAAPRAGDDAVGINVFAPAFQPLGADHSYRMSREEVMKGLANRFVHSTVYLYLYGTMALVSLVTVIISLTTACPGVSFYILELVVNVVLVLEVGIRLVAFGKHFWKSTFNVVDLCLVALCILTLLVLMFGHGCFPHRQRSGRREELIDSVLLIVRNVIQCARLLSVVRRSGYTMARRVPAINLSDAHGYNLDLDLEEEDTLARQRMLDGGDAPADGRGWSPQPHIPVQAAERHDTTIAVADDVGDL